VVITYGKFRTIDLGDEYKTQERRLVCPRNLIGTVGVLFPSDHGFQTGSSSAYVDALSPRAIVWNNAGRGPNPAPPSPPAANNGNANAGRAARAPDNSTPIWDVFQDAPGHPDLWQLHSSLGATAKNPPDDRIANLGDTDTDGNFIKISAEKSGSFTIQNSRNNYQKTY
jgi:competence protein ComEC